MKKVENPAVEEKTLKLELRLALLEKNEVCREKFLKFVKAMWPEFIGGRHHQIISDKLERVASGELKRLIINMAPRHTKSEFASFLFPAWMMGRNPKMKIIQATHTTELAVNFGRKTKNLLETDEYREVFPGVKLASDSKASGRWDTSAGGLTAVRASIPPSKWNAQYQQNPTGEENAIIKREWWRTWEEEKVPQLEFVIQSYDTAFSKKQTADYSAITTWGVFYPNEGGSGPNLILLDSVKGRWDFPELKEKALELYNFWEPDTVIIEAKASGTPLTQELRAQGIPVVNFTPSRGNDKVTRVHSVSPLFEAGMVWVPDEIWADELVEEVAAFPNGEFDDLVDSMTQALMRYRQGNFVQLPTDDWEDDENSAKVNVYY